MNRMKKIILLFIFSFISCFTYSQKLNNTLYHMRDLPQVNIVNPAFQHKAKLYIGIPVLNSIYANYSNSSFTYSDLIKQGTGLRADSLVYNVDGFMKAIKTVNLLTSQVEVNLLSVAYRYKNYSFSLGITEKSDARIAFGDKLIDYMYNGNFSSRGEDITLGPINIDATYYRELALGVSKIIDSKLSLGFKFKILAGMGNIYTKSSKLSAYTAQNGSEIKFSSKQVIYSSVPISSIGFNDKGGVDNIKFSSDDFGPEFFLNTKNLGFAVDLGLIYKADEKTTLSASIIDLGFISWKSDVMRFSQDTVFIYKGADWSQSINSKAPNYKPMGDLMNGVLDSLTTGFTVNAAEGSYTKALSAKIYLAAKYDISKKINLGVLSRTEISRGKLYPSLSFSANSSLGKHLSSSVSYTIVNNNFVNLGLGIAAKLGSVQLYAVSDNLIAAFKPNDTRTANIRLGVNLLFGNANDYENKTSCNLYPSQKKKKGKKKKSNFIFFRQKYNSKTRNIKNSKSRKYNNSNKKARNKIKKRHRW